MIVTIVTVNVKPEKVNDFIAASTRNHKSSIQEPGNLRFDFLRSEDDPNRFVLYEAYQSREAAAAHKKTRHYLEWKDTVADWMAKSRTGDPYIVLEPQDKNLW